jgi:hypothetical protein
MMLDQFGISAGVRLARKHLSWYSKGLTGAAEFRAQINRLDDADTVVRLVDHFFDPLIARGERRSSERRMDSFADQGTEAGASMAKAA